MAGTDLNVHVGGETAANIDFANASLDHHEPAGGSVRREDVDTEERRQAGTLKAAEAGRDDKQHPSHHDGDRQNGQRAGGQRHEGDHDGERDDADDEAQDEIGQSPPSAEMTPGSKQPTDHRDNARDRGDPTP